MYYESDISCLNIYALCTKNIQFYIPRVKNVRTNVIIELLINFK